MILKKIKGHKTRLQAPTPTQVGFMIFCVVPTTINSGIRQTEAAGGSFAMALMLSVTTNMVGVFTVPFVLSLLLEIE